MRLDVKQYSPVNRQYLRWFRSKPLQPVLATALTRNLARGFSKVNCGKLVLKAPARPGLIGVSKRIGFAGKSGKNRVGSYVAGY